MGAMARHVLQVKRKNSTNCSPPDARLTVAGSLASRFGPREVATGRAVASPEAGWVAGSDAGAARVRVGEVPPGGSVGTGAFVAVLSVAQAASRTASRLRTGRRRFFIISI